MMNLNSRIAQLLEILVNRWSFWDEYEDIYLELALTLVADPAASPERWERELFHEIRAELNPEDWQNLSELICAYRVAVRRQREEERRRQKEENRQREEERRRRNEENRQREEQQRRDEERRRREEECREEERQTLLENLRELFEQNFLAAHSFYYGRCAEHISFAEYKTEKINYVQSWAEDRLEPTPDSEQAAAIGAIEGHVKVVARAGSGKTATLVNRALFLQEHCGIAPDEMLLLAFNRSAAEEMRDRLTSYLQDSIPHVMTFHALAYALVNPNENLLLDNPEGEQSLSHAVQRLIDQYRHTNYYNEIRALMMAHFRADWERIVSGGHDRIPAEMLRYRRSLAQESLDGTYVKSFGEKVIANFLFEHTIEYKYERNFWWDGINYRPDFTIGDRSGVVIEYFGLEGDPDYDARSEEKRNYWQNQPNWKLLEFSPNDLASNGVDDFCNLLKEKLEDRGITYNQLSEEEIWHRIKHLRPIDRFTRAIVQFIQRCRKLSFTPEQLSERVNNHDCNSDVEQRFLHLAQVFYESYLAHLQETGEDDFDGLMQEAVEMVAEGNTEFRYRSRNRSHIGNLAQIQYILIDEYQDFSELFYHLMKAVREQNPRARFFCVGDDWQAINSFAGSDLRFFQNFEQLFEGSRELHIVTNYRSTRAVVNVGNELMRGLGRYACAHTDNAGKVMIADLGTFEPTPQEAAENYGDALTPAVLRLANKAINDDKNVVLLSRKNSLPWYVNYNDQGSQSITSDLDRFLELIHSRLPDELAEKVTISTTHKYKGLQQDVVIVLDAVPRCYPLIHPNLIFTRVLGDSVESVVAEERRLFYVALTRAVEELFILTETDNFSPFLEDLERNPELSKLEWSEYLPLVSIPRYTIRIGNQNGRGRKPTLDIKDRLKLEGYGWNGTTWHSIRSAEGFSVPEFINQARWSNSADGVEVRFYDSLENEVALYRIDSGEWSCIYDNI